MDILKSKEGELLSALTMAIRDRDKNLSVLQDNVNTKMELINEREKEISILKDNIIDVSKSLEEVCKKREEEKINYEAELLRQKQKMYSEIELAVDNEKCKREELKTNHACAIMDLARGMKKELEELELQLENEQLCSKTKLDECNKIQSDLNKKTKLLDVVHAKLIKSTEESISLKHKCKQSFIEKKELIVKLKAEMERNEKLVKENLDLKENNKNTSNNTVEKLEYMISKLNNNQENEMLLLSKLQKIADDKLDNITSSDNQQSDKLNSLCSVGVQTEDFENKCISDLTNQLTIIKEKEENLKCRVKYSENEMEDVKKQNEILKEVIRGMKRDRENMARQNEQEDEAHVKRLEERVKALRDSSLRNNNNSDIWIALARFKEEINVLKGRNWHRVTKHNLSYDDLDKENLLYLGVKEKIKKSVVEGAMSNKSILKRNRE